METHWREQKWNVGKGANSPCTEIPDMTPTILGILLEKDRNTLVVIAICSRAHSILKASLTV